MSSADTALALLIYERRMKAPLDALSAKIDQLTGENNALKLQVKSLEDEFKKQFTPSMTTGGASGDRDASLIAKILSDEYRLELIGRPERFGTRIITSNPQIFVEVDGLPGVNPLFCEKQRQHKADVAANKTGVHSKQPQADPSTRLNAMLQQFHREATDDSPFLPLATAQLAEKRTKLTALVKKLADMMIMVDPEKLKWKDYGNNRHYYSLFLESMAQEQGISIWKCNDSWAAGLLMSGELRGKRRSDDSVQRKEAERSSRRPRFNSPAPSGPHPSTSICLPLLSGTHQDDPGYTSNDSNAVDDD